MPPIHINGLDKAWKPTIHYGLPMLSPISVAVLEDDSGLKKNEFKLAVLKHLVIGQVFFWERRNEKEIFTFLNSLSCLNS